jgi:hypothetical protein
LGNDLDGNAWEIFYTKEDSEFESPGEPRDVSLCCAPPSCPVAIEFDLQMLGDKYVLKCSKSVITRVCGKIALSLLTNKVLK